MNESKTYQAYYTKSAPIVAYMVSSLGLEPNDRVLEPCGGDGVFVDEIIQFFPKVNLDVLELNQVSYEHLKDKYQFNANINVRQADTLLDDDLALMAKFGGQYDKVIANPPYGAWQDYAKRDLLRKMYPNIYVKETYGLFLCRCIDLLKEGGKLAFIIPDTFLNLHNHKELRRILLTNTRIETLSLFPSSFFPNVNFGYANLCIIVLEKSSNQTNSLSNSISIRKGFKSVNGLMSADVEKTLFKQLDIYANDGHTFLLNDNMAVETINKFQQTIGDIADCVTGFYSGNDKAFLKTKSTVHRSAKKYEALDDDAICKDYASNQLILEGLPDESAHFIPIVKGGNVRFAKPSDWFINWSKTAVRHYKMDKKARFQNPKYYFREGLAVPMVSSSSITAALLEGRVFDQSIVGVFPKDERLTWYLLAFFNSPTANALIRAINPSTNNSANYIKKIPFAMPSSDKMEQIEALAKEIYLECKTNGTTDPDRLNELNSIIAQVYETQLQD